MPKTFKDAGYEAPCLHPGCNKLLTIPTKYGVFCEDKHGLERAREAYVLERAFLLETLKKAGL